MTESNGKPLAFSLPKPEQALEWPPKGYERVAGMRVLRSMKTDAKEEDVEVHVPDFFQRTGNRTFKIETGLGIVRCIVARDDVKDRCERDRDAYYKRTAQQPSEEDKRTDMLYMVLAKSLVAIPSDWRVEDDEVKIGDLALTYGDPVPQPHDVSITTPLAAMTYLGLLPPSLQQQLVYCLGLMTSCPPIEMEVAANPPQPAGSTT